MRRLYLGHPGGAPAPSGPVDCARISTANPPRALHCAAVHVGATLLVTTLALAGFPRGPLVAPAQPKAQQQQHTRLGSPAALLGAEAPAALPFVQHAQGNPVLARHGLAYDPQANNLLLTTLAVPTGAASLPGRTARPAWEAPQPPPNLALLAPAAPTTA